MNGSNRSWGYASYDMDDPDNQKLTYTSYERSGSVNRYTNNGDGGHTHGNWKDSNDYNLGKDPDFERINSNSSSNPSTGEVQSNGGCFLTTACMKHMKEKFDDNCYELDILRWFRDNFVSKEDKKEYYEKAPMIVTKINSEDNCNEIYNNIYENVIAICVRAIEYGKYDFAYNTYKKCVLDLEENYINNKQKRLLKY